MTIKKILLYLCLLAAFVLAGRIVEGQTQLAPHDLAPPIPGGVVFVIAPDGRTAFARLDPTLQLTADPSGFLVLKATPAVVDRVVTFKPSAVATAITLPSDPQGNSLLVHCNGLALTEPDDYSRNGRVLTFTEPHAPRAGYLYHIRYRE